MFKKISKQNEIMKLDNFMVLLRKVHCVGLEDGWVVKCTEFGFQYLQQAALNYL